MTIKTWRKRRDDDDQAWNARKPDTNYMKAEIEDLRQEVKDLTAALAASEAAIKKAGVNI